MDNLFKLKKYIYQFTALLYNDEITIALTY